MSVSGCIVAMTLG